MEAIMKNLALYVVSVMAMTLVSLSVQAQDIPLPADWNKWPEVQTRLSSVAALPSCEADVALLPPIYQKVVETYCVLKLNGPGKVDVLVNPAVLKSYEARDGNMPDGVNMILRFRGVRLLLVTAHQGGKPVYTVYNEDGKNVTQPSGPLAVETCVSCHTAYQSYCKNGQCGSKK